MKRQDKKNLRTLEQSIKAMQEKLAKEKAQYDTEPLTIEMDNSTGGTVTKANPFVVEYRNMLKDYSSALKTYKALTEETEGAKTSALSDIRERFKVAK